MLFFQSRSPFDAAGTMGIREHVFVAVVFAGSTQQRNINECGQYQQHKSDHAARVCGRIVGPFIFMFRCAERIIRRRHVRAYPEHDTDDSF